MEMADDLVEEIVKRLPLESLLRFRIVSKGWNCLLRQVWADAVNKQPDLLVSLPNPKEGCFIYSFLTRKWRPLFFPFISAPECTILGCGAPGLLLLNIPALPSSSSSWVCNPFTGTSFPLPPLKFPLNVLGRWVVQGQTRGTFNVLLVGKKCTEEEEVIQVHEYDSVSNSWNEMGEFHDSGKNCRREKSGETTFCNGFVFVMGRDSVAVFDRKEGRWNRVGIPAGAVARNNVWPRLVSCGRSVVVVRLLKRRNVLEEVIMWELCGGGNGEWKEKGRMPEWARGKLQRSWIECVGVGENVCFRSHGSGEIVVCSLGEESWHCLPKCPAPFINNSRVRGLAFQHPSPATSGGSNLEPSSL